ncbi:hypothetical protein GIY23_06930 [Allosaccharopolyspora coralli]|uniref:Uncharacterized protein n=1 Tax=Allosaccharopolyspora coralli TaxID=2665642 RepID=A0A5Q3QCV2_9PSEU|nr:hypothetical protein [Allosaccharopolyspora coralli]QGK69305.1 hypothetical protein GIY23_06930 [Allosaccharopolyspora coralli]
MSAPGIGKETHVALPDWSTVERLPKPLKALVYLVLLSLLTTAAIGALLLTVAIIGLLTGSFPVGALLF